MLLLKITKRNFDKAIKLSKIDHLATNCVVAVAARDNLKLDLIGIGFTVLSLANDKPTLHCINGDMPDLVRQFDNLYPFNDNDKILELRATFPIKLEFDTL
jgi:hypothetical protein